MNEKNYSTFFCASVLVGAVTLLTISGPTYATPRLASQTGKPCAQCHQKPDGGPELTPYGKAFQANGDKVPTPPAK